MTCASADLLQVVERQLATTSTFSSLTASCDGAFPARIADVLKHLSPKLALASERLVEAGQTHFARPFCDSRLPLPHPLDFEWRFSNTTIDQLLGRLSSVCDPQDKVLLVCTPAVALRAFDSDRFRHLIYASRMDDPVTASLKEICDERVQFVDVRDDLSRIGATGAIVDPPWYDDIALPLVTQTLRGLAQSGALLVCFPDRLSGCSSASMLSKIVRDSKAFGLEHLRLLGDKLRYETPFFELSALRDQGLYSVHPQWRTGRLAFGRRTLNEIPMHRFPAGEDWSEIGEGGWRMRLRQPPTNLVGSDKARFNVRRSISRVSTGAGDEQCWTVGNRVAYAPIRTCTKHLLLAMRAIERIEMNEVRRFLKHEPGECKNVLDNGQIMIAPTERAIYSGSNVS